LELQNIWHTYYTHCGQVVLKGNSWFVIRLRKENEGVLMKNFTASFLWCSVLT
jgi:hypothetical protein